ncbi:PREDICTED: E3 ubiquitin-protein ligase PRT1-like [Lupinus angustifolius]|nr:PREDICTED: E3 ubiquitin-protein ligase PRT1-like [Lupinus angustifolius]
MEKNSLQDLNFVDNNDHEEIPECFVCCVCLDLLYKPIVLACGHMCCFWCVHKSMSCLRESQCPFCRNQYYHFPTICQMLHFMLLKIYPVAYKGREIQTLEEEKKTGFYSPQFDADTGRSQTKFGHSGSPSSSSSINLVSNTCNGGTSECIERLQSAAQEGDEGTIVFEHSSYGAPIGIGTPSAEGKLLSENELLPQQKISVEDVMCTMCKQLLFHPVVLNCGHVYCETCVVNLADEDLRCQVCQLPHPKGLPKVCLGFDQFLEETFPEDYARRRVAVQLSKTKAQPVTSSNCSSDNGNKGENIDWWSDPDSKVHIGVGCDFCGMFPIIGDRYKCSDCKEKMGFDLCSDCYNTRSKLPGRFNQQHTSEHKFKLVQPNIIRNIMLRLVTGQSADNSIDSETFENLQFTSEALFDEGEENQNDSEATS